MPSFLTVLLVVLTSALLLRYVIWIDRPLSRWMDFLPAVGLLVAVGQAWAASGISAFLVLASLPLYAVVGLLLLFTLPRVFSRRHRVPGARWRWGKRVAAVGGLVLVVFGADRVVEMRGLLESRHRFAALLNEKTVTDLTSLSWTGSFSALRDQMIAEYPFTRWKGIDWAVLHAEIAPQVAAAEASKDERAWYRALRELAWSVPDGHVGIQEDDHGLRHDEVGGGFGCQIVQLDDGRVLAKRVTPGGPAAGAGMRFGAEILVWNGAPIHDALGGVPVLWSEEPPATSEGRRLQQARFLVRGAAGSKASLTFRNRGERLARTVELTAVEEPEEPKPFNVIRDILFGSPIEVRRLAEGPGYIRIKFELPALFDLHPERDVARALERFRAANVPGLVLDVRGNIGGQDSMIARLSAFFQRRERFYEMAAVYDSETRRFLPHPETTVRLVPQEPRWTGKVAVLVDASTLSSGEGIPLALRGLPGVALFGWSATQGSFGINQKTVLFPGGLKLVFPQAPSLDAQGQIQVDSDASGLGGIPPDHRVPLDEAAFNAAYGEGKDVVLETAVQWLKRVDSPRRE
ncbi:MAG TPA: S41 family peptidase [Thermoanaerobaculia bacterium]|jgi:carboxyl-terminal processing protease|nr:S41 family peptidase [Thermoanaerobaculia bacterium]